jgi:hypothetical protein
VHRHGPSRRRQAFPRPRPSPWSSRPPRPLWAPSGASDLAYLTGPLRMLRPETIRAARLGSVPGPLDLPGKPSGVLIPWFDGPRLALLKLRQPGGRRLKYYELYRDRPSVYPSPGAPRPGFPLIVAEGEPDTLLLGQELGPLAPVVTLGSSSARPDPPILGSMLAASP